MKLREWQISVSMVCIVLGALLAVQIRTQNEVYRGIPTRRVEDLALMLQRLEEEKGQLIKENDELKTSLEDAAKGRNLFNSISAELEHVKVRSGLVRVHGPGVTVKLQDSAQQPKPGEDPNLYLVHEEDLLKIPNELFAAGAEAVSINEQRLIATSEIRCAGPVIMVNNTRIASPYIIKAIGDAEALESALMMRGGIVETLKTWGIRINITKSEEVVLPAYKGTTASAYATPLEEEE